MAGLYRAGRRETRLLELARQAGFTDYIPSNPLGGDSRASSEVLSNQTAASEALKKLRTEEFESRKHFLRRSPSKSSFKSKEIVVALQRVLDSTTSIGNAGQAKALLQLCTESKAKKSAGIFKSQPEQSIDLAPNFHRLANLGIYDMVEILAPQVTQTDLDRAAQDGMRKRDRHLLTILLDSGASLSQYTAEFAASVLVEDTDYIAILLSGKQTFSQSALDRALLAAVSRMDLKLVSLLLKHQADTDFNHGEALLYAVSAVRADIVAAICLSERSPSPETLTRAIVPAKSIPASTDRMAMIEILLAAGACGDELARLLIEAVKYEHQAFLIDMLVDYGVSLSFANSEAIFQSMIRSDHEVFKLLMKPPPSANALSIALSRASLQLEAISTTMRLTMVTAILKKGAGRSQSSIDLSLLHAARIQDITLAQFLVSEGASADHESGQSLCYAVEQRSEELLNVLLQANPSNASKTRAFANLELLPRPIRHVMATTLLRIGTHGAEVNNLLHLMFSTTTSPALRDYELIDTLVQGGADVNTGPSICTAAADGDLQGIQILCRGNVSPTTLASGIPFASRVTDTKTRFACIDALLTAGATGHAVHHGLAEAMVDSSDSEALVSLFIEKGQIDIDAYGGGAIEQSITMENVSFLKTVLQRPTSISTLDLMLAPAVNVRNRRTRIDIFKLLLRKGVSSDALDSVLVTIASHEPVDIELVKVMLSHKASVDHQDGEALRTAIEHANIDLFTILAKEPAQSRTLASALDAAFNMPNPSQRLAFSKVILDTAAGSIRYTVERLLSRATCQAEPDREFLLLLLEHVASVDFNEGKCVQLAIRNHDFKTLEMFLTTKVSGGTLSKAFHWSLEQVEEYRIGLVTLVLGADASRKCPVEQALVRVVHAATRSRGLITLLLNHGASVHHEEHSTLKEATRTADPVTLELLLEKATDRLGISTVFHMAILTEGAWATLPALQCLRLLVLHGAHGPALDAALIRAVAMVHRSRSEILSFIDLLIAEGASGTFHDGEAIKSAAQRGDVTLIEKLLSSGPSPEACVVAFKMFLQAENTIEADALNLFKKVECHFRRIERRIVWKENQSKLQPVLYLCLRRWPKGKMLIYSLLKDRDHVEETVKKPKRDANEPEEKLSILLWCIWCQGEKVGLDVIRALLNAGGKIVFLNVHMLQSLTKQANVNFVTERTRTTPLMASIDQSRVDITTLLIKEGADVTVHDAKDRSLLFLATQKGNFDIISELVVAKAPVKDGSLHEAARLCNAEAVRLLLRNGHDARFTSFDHGGRDALEELCLNCAVKDKSAIRNTIEALGYTGHENKTCIFLALDNQNAPREITSALIDVFMYAYLDDPKNLYRKGRFVYSPKSYVKKGLQRSPPDVGRDLERILTAKSPEIFYREDGEDQPDDIQGAPERIMEDFREQQRRRKHLAQQAEDHRIQMDLRREEHEVQVLQQKELALLGQQLKQQDHKLALEHESERARARDANTVRVANLQRDIALRNNNDSEAFASRQRSADLNHAQSLARQELEATKGKQRAQLEYRRDTALVDQTVEDHKVKAQRQIEDYRLSIADRNRRADEVAAESQFKREKLLIKEKREGTRDQMKLIDSQRELARLASSVQQCQLAESEYYQPD